MGGALPTPGGLGRGDDRGDIHLLSLAAPASQAPQEHQHARAPQRGDQEADLRGADLPQCGLMLPTGASAGGGNPRELARSPPLPQHGGPEGAQENHSSRSRLANVTGRPALQNLTHTIENAWSAPDLNTGKSK